MSVLFDLKSVDKSTFARISGPNAYFNLPYHFRRCAAIPVLLIIKITELGHELSYFEKIQDFGVDFHFIMLLNSKTWLEFSKLLNFKRQIQNLVHTDNVGGSPPHRRFCNHIESPEKTYRLDSRFGQEFLEFSSC